VWGTDKAISLRILYRINVTAATAKSKR